MTQMQYQRKWGLFLGALTGLGFALVSQTVNSIIVPGIPLYHPPFGAVGNIALGLLLGAAIGLTTTWHETAALGVLFGSLLGALAVTVASFFTGSLDVGLRTIKIMGLLFIFVPIMATLAPLLILFRWIIYREDLAVREIHAGFRMPLWPRVLLPALLVLASSALGLSLQFNELAREAVPAMHALLQQGIQAPSVESLPDPLRTDEVKSFMERGKGPYELEWQKDEENHYAIPRPAASMKTYSVVVAHYQNGYLLVCGFPGVPSGKPRCKDFSTP